ncbi:MAG: TIGR01458 family HAD-type hydrolase [Acidobacteria bacterium]|nr:MAG: TIGR01458 family HAD-type hydrolase [Acidobacteriota bacterium]
MLQDVKGFLVDLDGTLHTDNAAVPGVAESLDQLRGLGYSFRFVTNTTNKSRATLQKKIGGFGIPVTESEIFSAPFAAAQWLQKSPEARCWVLTRGDSITDFEGLHLTHQDPNFIVLGDLMSGFSFELLNDVFRKLFDGAELVALQKNRYWLTEGKLTIDAGAFVAALEYASGKAARLIGKPSRDFFNLAVANIGLLPKQLAMVGDDIEADIQGAQEAGLKTILVKTGKFQQEVVQKAGIQPDALIESIADLPVLMRHS